MAWRALPLLESGHALTPRVCVQSPTSLLPRTDTLESPRNCRVRTSPVLPKTRVGKGDGSEYCCCPVAVNKVLPTYTDALGCFVAKSFAPYGTWRLPPASRFPAVRHLSHLSVTRPRNTSATTNGLAPPNTDIRQNVDCFRTEADIPAGALKFSFSPLPRTPRPCPAPARPLRPGPLLLRPTPSPPSTGAGLGTRSILGGRPGRRRGGLEPRVCGAARRVAEHKQSQASRPRRDVNCSQRLG